jgi:hypothetical protein
MKKTIILLATLAISLVTSNAASVSVTNLRGDFSINALADSSDNLLTGASSIIAYGIFNIDDSLIVSATSLTYLTDNFAQAGDSFTIDVASPGYYSSVVNQTIPAMSPFIGKNVYQFVGNAATLETSTEILIFKYNSVWVQDPGVTSDALLTDETPVVGNLLQGNIGVVTARNLFDAGLQDTYSLVTVVPEPSSIALLGLGSIALLLRRSR